MEEFKVCKSCFVKKHSTIDNFRKFKKNKCEYFRGKCIECERKYSSVYLKNNNTWTWQIDHIIPHSKFIYKNMECSAFLQCWSLNNLRPYNAKFNIIDGATKIRHTLGDNIT